MQKVTKIIALGVRRNFQGYTGKKVDNHWFTHQIFPSWQHKRILSVHQPPEAALDRHQDVLGLEAKDCKGKKALAEVKKAVKEDQLQVDAAHPVHDQGPHAQGNACANNFFFTKMKLEIIKSIRLCDTMGIQIL